MLEPDCLGTPACHNSGVHHSENEYDAATQTSCLSPVSV